MKKHINKVLILGLSLFALIAVNGCAEEDPIPGTNFVYGVGLNDQNNGFLTFNGGTVTIVEIGWDGTLQGGSAVTSFTSAVQTTFDLATGLATPEIPLTEIDPGVYQNISIGMELLDNGADNNMVLEGVFTNASSETTPIVFKFKSGEVFEGSLASYTIPSGRDTKAELILDPVSWFVNVSQADLDAATLNASNEIEISPTSNTAIFDKVETQLLISTTNGSIEFFTLN